MRTGTTTALACAQLAAALLLSSGCAGGASRIVLRYDAPPPQSAPGRPKLALTVSDRSDGFTTVHPPGNLTEIPPPAVPVVDTLRTAVAAELSSLGYVLAPAGQAEAHLAVVLRRAAVSWPFGAQAMVTGELDLTATVKDRAYNVIQEEDLTGKGYGRTTVLGAGLPGSGPNDAINAAFADALKKFRELLSSEDLTARLRGAPAPAPASAPAPVAAAAPAPASDVDAPSGPAAAPNPHAEAIVIGIGAYRQNLPAADFADGDARAVASHLRHDLGFLDENVATLINGQAARSDFEKYFERWLPNRVRAGDEVFVYFSGHGAPNPGTGDSYLVPYDGDPAYLPETAYPVKRLYAALAKLPAKKITVVMDSCFSGAGGRSVIAKGARPLVSVAVSEIPAGITVIAASAGDQVSNSFQQKGHGLFTYFFLKGLDAHRGDLRGVYDYLKPQVSGYARRELNADQDPQWREGR